MYHFRSFPGSRFPFLFPLIVPPCFPSVVARPVVPIVWRAACPAAICLRFVCRFDTSLPAISFRFAYRSRIVDVGIAPFPVSVWRGEWRGASATGSCGSCLVSPSTIELTKTVHSVIRLCRDCVVPASPYSAHIIYTRTRYYVFIKMRSRRQCPMVGNIGSEVFQNEGISS